MTAHQRAALARPASSDLGAKLRAAAARGRAAEVEALLDQGAPVDEPDDQGDTALIRAVRAGHADAAAALRRRGADVDRQNHVGESARDFATKRGDAALKSALGIDD